MKKWLLVGWILLGLLVIWGAFSMAQKSFTICWDGLEVDEAQLMEMCGITRADYLSGNYDREACPNADETTYMIGGCEPDLPAVWAATGVVGLGYLVLSLVGFALWQLVRRFLNR